VRGLVTDWKNEYVARSTITYSSPSLPVRPEAFPAIDAGHAAVVFEASAADAALLANSLLLTVRSSTLYCTLQSVWYAASAASALRTLFESMTVSSDAAWLDRLAAESRAVIARSTIEHHSPAVSTSPCMTASSCKG